MNSKLFSLSIPDEKKKLLHELRTKFFKVDALEEGIFLSRNLESKIQREKILGSWQNPTKQTIQSDLETQIT